MKYLLFVGAGAETVYSLPGGADYVIGSILTKRPKMYDALSNYYETAVASEYTDYTNKYTSQYLLSQSTDRQSRMLVEIVSKALWHLKINGCEDDILRTFVQNVDDSIKNYDDYEDIPSQERPNLDKVSRSLIEKYISSIIICDEDNPNKTPTEIKELRKKFEYSGEIEKFFSTIINPKNLGNTKFWKLVNYFWSAFFTIIVPIIEHTDHAKKIEYQSNKYKYILDNLEILLNEIYSRKFIEQYQSTVKNDYYGVFADKLKPKYIATTNYTPFVRLLNGSDGEKDDDNISYLAGELRYFEDPYRLEVKEYREFPEHSLVFPFLMTQASVKPIVSTYQIKSYAKFLKHLYEVDVVVILGFSLCKDDNHINALLHDYLKDDTHHLLYCDYDGKVDVYDSLRLSKDRNNIHIIKNNGYPQELVRKIKDKLDEIQIDINE